jgi:hypothetical protein
LCLELLIVGRFSYIIHFLLYTITLPNLTSNPTQNLITISHSFNSDHPTFSCPALETLITVFISEEAADAQSVQYSEWKKTNNAVIVLPVIKVRSGQTNKLHGP